ncbi:MAG: AraC family transcriptional regulator [Burkholderiales bacterium]|nr:AraC family transcriptional regulator [Burkholderiales bacterium]
MSVGNQMKAASPKRPVAKPIAARDFYAKQGISSPYAIFDLLTDTFYFAKNADGQFVCANKLLQEKFNLQSADEVIGKTDFDFLTHDVASRIRDDDLAVMAGSLVIKDKFEVVVGVDGKLFWLFTTKVPIKNHKGEIVGVEGFSRDAERSQNIIEPFQVFKASIEFMQREYMNDINIAQLADLSCMSLSTFERKFKKHFSQTPMQYLKHLRIHHACKLLAAGYGIKRAFSETGFCDQSYFTKEFRSVTGMTPRQFFLLSGQKNEQDEELELV